MHKKHKMMQNDQKSTLDVHKEEQDYDHKVTKND